jgi:ketosteroid isomerase-like protein
MSKSAIDVARALHAALAAGKKGVELRDLFDEGATVLEHPNLVKPQGGTAGLDELLRQSESGANLLAEQRYEVHSAIEHGETAIVRLTWTGVIGRDIGRFRAGQVLTAHIAQFIETRHGRVSAIETFDCYEPLP